MFCREAHKGTLCCFPQETHAGLFCSLLFAVSRRKATLDYLARFCQLFCAGNLGTTAEIGCLEFEQDKEGMNDQTRSRLSFELQAHISFSLAD
jgi:hypothetical protein